MGHPARLIVETYSRDFQIIQRFSWNWVCIFKKQPKAFTPFISKTLPFDFGEISSRIYRIYSAFISPHWVSEITRLHVKFASPSLVTKKLKSSNRIDQFTRQSILRLIVITFTSNINNSVLLKPIKRRLYSYLAHRLSLVNSDILSKAKWNRYGLVFCWNCIKIVLTLGFWFSSQK